MKGAQLMLLWAGETVRSTRDADLLGLGDLSNDNLQRIFADLCALLVPDDGMEYLVETIRITAIREETTYGGRRVAIQARLGNARLHLQVDVGLGDAIAPEPEWVELPQLLDLPAIRLRAYRPETSIAEKLETMVALGLVNSRMKDYFDIYVLSLRGAFDQSVLARSIGETFRRRGTQLPSGLPVGLSGVYAEEPGKPRSGAASSPGLTRRAFPTISAPSSKQSHLSLGPSWSQRERAMRAQGTGRLAARGAARRSGSSPKWDARVASPNHTLWTIGPGLALTHSTAAAMRPRSGAVSSGPAT